MAHQRPSVLERDAVLVAHAIEEIAGIHAAIEFVEMDLALGVGMGDLGDLGASACHQKHAIEDTSRQLRIGDQPRRCYGGCAQVADFRLQFWIVPRGRQHDERSVFSIQGVALQLEEHLVYVGSIAGIGHQVTIHFVDAHAARPGAHQIDAHLGDGLYLYWRSVVTLSHKALPSFGDARPEGIQKMQTVEREGVFLSPGATLGLAFTWIEERDTPRALEACQKNHRRYPDNVINNLVASRVHLSRRELTQSLKKLDEVLEDAPDNERAHYYYATVYLRMGRLEDAERALDTYLGFNLEPDQRAQALYRKGDVALRREHFGDARGHYEQSASLGYKPAAEKLTRLASLEQAAATR